MNNTTDDLGGASMIYHELHAVIRRYMSESGDTTVFAVVGALEAAKQDVLDTLGRHNERTGNVE